MGIFTKKDNQTTTSPNEVSATSTKAEAKQVKRAEFQKMLDEEKQELAARNENYRLVNAYQQAHKKEEKVAPKDVFLSAQHLNKIYSNRVQAVSDLSIDIAKGEFIVMVGPSGCGKSTTLRMLAGLEDITSGDLYIDGEYANDLEPIDRGVAMVFQSYALYPHMSVYDNMAFGLQSMKIREPVLDENGVAKKDKNGKPVFHKRPLTKEEIDARIQDAAKKLQITEYLQRKPTQLSGGQCQRVALGRAVVRNAKIFLLDEPLSNLDAKLRVQMRSELIRLHAELGNTMIYVTHDQTEAMTMASRIMVLNKGRVQQIGTPHEVYDTPENIFVATFMGSPTMNILSAHYADGVLTFKDGKKTTLTPNEKKAFQAYYEARKSFLDQDISRLSSLDEETKKKQLYSIDALLASEREERVAIEKLFNTKEEDVYFGIRPEDMAFSKTKETAFAVKIDVSELLGAEYNLHFVLSGKEVVARVGADEKILAGDQGFISFLPSQMHLFDTLTQKRIF